MTSGERWRLGHRPGLDGLRGVAILLVLVGHVLGWIWPSALGSAGVTVFFTLSGFLITSLLLEELDRRGQVSWAGFYARRGRRLLPALSVLLVVVSGLLLLAGADPWGRVLPIVGYVGNWWAAVLGRPAGLLEHTWSLGVEEQFYLVWPVVLVAVSRWRRAPLAVAVACIIGSVAARFLLWDGGRGFERVYYGTDTRADGLFVGCLLALLVASGWRPRVSTAAGMTLVGALLLVSIVATGRTMPGLVVPTIAPWLTASLVVLALDSPRWLTGNVLRWFGRRSYGIYLWHYPLVFLAWGFTGSVAATTAAVLASLGIAEVSWRLVERPVLRNARHAAQELERGDALRRSAVARRGDADVRWGERLGESRIPG